MDALDKIMAADIALRLGVSSMSEEQQQTLYEWGIWMFSLGDPVIERIREVKFGGRLIILEDDTCWEVDSKDVETAQSWADRADRVVIIEGEMFRLNALDKVNVEEDI